MKKKLVIANWKMNLNMHESSIFLHKLSEKVKTHRAIDVILAPSIFTLQSLSIQVNHRQFKLAAQNFYWRDHGAFTGEVAISQLRGIVQYAIVGHSERRNLFFESDKEVRAKVAAAIRNNIRPILCIGENADERNFGETNLVLSDQLAGGLANVSSEDIEKIVIAYEPVWAIGTGVNAKPNDIKVAARVIRNQIKELYGAEMAKKIQVVYGGSIQPESAADYSKIDEIDGLFVGGASLSAEKFTQIIDKVYETVKG
ncbi:MAG: triose-phosphate isomerase [bacterium]|nr:triose-phosphate isomerase [bacterium]